MVRPGRESALERRAQIRERVAHLGAAALPVRRRERDLRAEHERHAEQPVHHALVHLARELDALVEAPRALLLASGDARARREGGELAERPHGVALVVGELEAAASAVGEDHPEPAVGSGQRRAGEGGDLEGALVARRDLTRELLGRQLLHLVEPERALRHGRLLERAVHVHEQRGVDAVRAGGHHARE